MTNDDRVGRHDDPIFRDLLDYSIRRDKHFRLILDVVWDEHYELHAGAIIYCASEACRLVAQHRAA